MLQEFVKYSGKLQKKYRRNFEFLPKNTTYLTLFGGLKQSNGRQGRALKIECHYSINTLNSSTISPSPRLTRILTVSIKFTILTYIRAMGVPMKQSTMGYPGLVFRQQCKFNYFQVSGTRLPSQCGCVKKGVPHQSRGS